MNHAKAPTSVGDLLVVNSNFGLGLRDALHREMAHFVHGTDLRCGKAIWDVSVMLGQIEFGKWFFLIVLTCLILSYFALIFHLEIPAPFLEPLQS